MNSRYVVIGGGMTADAAVKALRKADPTGDVVLVSDEAQAPYKRPPLSKGLWKGDPDERANLGTADTGAELLLGRRAVELDTANSVVRLDDGTSLGYQQLLLATGAHARGLPSMAGLEGVVAYRTWRDYEYVKRSVAEGTRVAVVGGGFIGSEMAAALNKQGAAVTMIFPEAHMGGGRFPESIASLVDADYESRGVTLLPGRTVDAATTTEGGVRLELSDGSSFDAELVLVGVGAQPNQELAEGAGLQTGNGVLVDEHLNVLTADGPLRNVFAAGDVASFDWRALGKRLRIEHEDNAYSMGAAAGRNMAAAANAEDGAGPQLAEYTHLPFFYSDLFDNGYEAVGLLDPRLQVVEDWRVPGAEGVVYFLEDGLVKGVLLWNTWGQVDAARELIEARTPLSPEDLMGRLPSDD